MQTIMLLLLSLFSTISHGEILNRTFDNVTLYQVTKPYHEDYLRVSPDHEIYYALFGNSSGVPVVLVHGGPGAGCFEQLTALFDLDFYHVIMFDQRGAMRSRPFADMHDNTPQASVHDMDLLRCHLGIDKWLLFGGSYGSFLSLLYGQTHPERVLGFILRGIFLGSKKNYEHLFYGMKQFFPESWHEMVNLLPKDQQHELIAALHELVMHSDPAVHMPISHAFMHYDTLCSQVCMNPATFDQASISDEIALSISRAFIHYAVHKFYVDDNQILDNMDRIAHLPAIIIHGRYDLICVPENAYDLHHLWPDTQLWFVPNGGHSLKEPSIAGGLKTALEDFKHICTSA